MLKLRRRKDPCAGTVLFRGSPAPRPEHMTYLDRAGISLGPPGGESSGWSLDATHPTWGAAKVLALDMPLPSSSAASMQPHLTDEDIGAFESAGHSLQVVAPPEGGALRDRKRLLWYLRQVMSDDGLIALDHQSQLVWTRAALDDELTHEADVDVESLYSIHAVYQPRPGAGEDEEHDVYWVHTHGLGELGALDLDILRPSADAMGAISDALRCLAFAVLEGEVSEGARFEFAHPGGIARFVGAGAFDRSCIPHCRGIRDAEDHTERRLVLCEPRRGLLSRLGGAGHRPCKFFTRPIGENAIFRFSRSASDLMAARARATVGVFAGLVEELADMPAAPLVKLGCPVRGEEGAEHLWFEAHGVRGDRVDATLVNQPYGDVGHTLGERAEHALDLLSDWAISTPVGQISPRTLAPARLLRERREEILELVRQSERG